MSTSPYNRSDLVDKYSATTIRDHYCFYIVSSVSSYSYSLANSVGKFTVIYIQPVFITNNNST